MAQSIADRRDVDFVLYEQLEAEDLVKLERYQDLNKKCLIWLLRKQEILQSKKYSP